VQTAGDAMLRGAPDTVYLERSLAAARVLVTHDGDFLRLHRTRIPHAGIAFSEQGTRSIGQMISGLVLIHDVLEPGDMAGRVEFL
jgi:hypothetical protein